MGNPSRHPVRVTATPGCHPESGCGDGGASCTAQGPAPGSHHHPTPDTSSLDRMDLQVSTDVELDHVSAELPCARRETGTKPTQETSRSDSALCPKIKFQGQPFATSHRGKDGEGQLLAFLGTSSEKEELDDTDEPLNLLEYDMMWTIGQVDHMCEQIDAEVQPALPQQDYDDENMWDPLDPEHSGLRKGRSWSGVASWECMSMWIGRRLVEIRMETW